MSPQFSPCWSCMFPFQNVLPSLNLHCLCFTAVLSPHCPIGSLNPSALPCTTFLYVYWPLTFGSAPLSPYLTLCSQPILVLIPCLHPRVLSLDIIIINSTGISKWDPISSPSFTGCSGPQRRRSLSRPCCSLWHNNCLLHTSPYPRTLRRGWDQLAKFDACAGWLNKSSCIFYSSSEGSEVVFLSTSNAGPGPPRALYNQPDSQ